MRIYIAASSAPSEHGRVTAAFTAARLAGITITLDWRVGHCPTVDMTAEERHAAAEADVVAITSADLIWVLAPPVRSDALVEMGYALALVETDVHRAAQWKVPRERRLIVSGPLAARGIFAALADEEHDEDADAWDSIRARVEAGR